LSGVLKELLTNATSDATAQSDRTAVIPTKRKKNTYHNKDDKHNGIVAVGASAGIPAYQIQQVKIIIISCDTVFVGSGCDKVAVAVCGC